MWYDVIWFDVMWTDKNLRGKLGLRGRSKVLKKVLGEVGYQYNRITDKNWALAVENRKGVPCTGRT